jgi:hypothetical protein
MRDFISASPFYCCWLIHRLDLRSEQYYALKKNEVSRDVTQLHWSDGPRCSVGPLWLHCQGTAVGSAWPWRTSHDDFHKILELLVWRHGDTHKKAWIFSNAAVKTSYIATALMSLLYQIVRPCRLVLDYNRHGINISEERRFELRCGGRPKYRKYSAFGMSLCTYKRCWKWCPRASIQAWTPLILFANTFCRSDCEMLVMYAVIAVFNSLSVRGRSRYAADFGAPYR